MAVSDSDINILYRLDVTWMSSSLSSEKHRNINRTAICVGATFKYMSMAAVLICLHMKFHTVADRSDKAMPSTNFTARLILLLNLFAEICQLRLVWGV